MKMKTQYNKNKIASVGDLCICPSCETEFVKSQHQQAFCKSKSGTQCKDKYWNTIDPQKRNNTTRISSASQMWIDKNHSENTSYGADFDDDQSWDSHKNSF